MSKTKIEQALNAAFRPTHLEVIDDGHKHIGHEGAKHGGHFTVIITSQAFEGKSLLERHRMVYAAIEPIRHLIHALAIKAKSPQE